MCLGYSDAADKKKDTNGAEGGVAIDPMGSRADVDEDEFGTLCRNLKCFVGRHVV